MKNISEAGQALQEALGLLHKERKNMKEKEARIKKANELLDKAHVILKQLDKGEVA